jgi:integrase
MMNALQTEKKQHDELYPASCWVFSRCGEPIKNFVRQWQTATTKVGLSGLLFHDLRRTAVRNMVRIHGLDRSVAKHISGHLTGSMFERYNIIDEADIKAAKRKVDEARTSTMQSPQISPELLATLAGVSEEKLKALIALLK